jgi:hypothetical protein
LEQYPLKDRRHPDGTVDLVAEVGCSYRQLDYWIRTGKVELSSESSPGSGRARVVSEVEAVGVRAVADAYRRAREIIAEIDSGLTFRHAVEEASADPGLSRVRDTTSSQIVDIANYNDVGCTA